jgi:hypothetical protein
MSRNDVNPAPGHARACSRCRRHAQKARPAPVITTARTRESPAAEHGLRQFLRQFVRERVQLVRPVQRDGSDGVIVGVEAHEHGTYSVIASG